MSHTTPESIYLSRDRWVISLNLFGEDELRASASELSFTLLASRLPEVGLLFSEPLTRGSSRTSREVTRLTGQRQDDRCSGKKKFRVTEAGLALYGWSRGFFCGMLWEPPQKNVFHQLAAGAWCSRSQPSYWKLIHWKLIHQKLPCWMINRPSNQLNSGFLKVCCVSLQPSCNQYRVGEGRGVGAKGRFCPFGIITYLSFLWNCLIIDSLKTCFN